MVEEGPMSNRGLARTLRAREHVQRCHEPVRHPLYSRDMNICRPSLVLSEKFEHFHVDPVLSLVVQRRETASRDPQTSPSSGQAEGV
jgi:hypothetical protein